MEDGHKDRDGQHSHVGLGHVSDCSKPMLAETIAAIEGRTRAVEQTVERVSKIRTALEIPNISNDQRRQWEANLLQYAAEGDADDGVRPGIAKEAGNAGVETELPRWI